MSEVDASQSSRLSQRWILFIFFLLASFLFAGCTTVAIQPVKAVSGQKAQAILQVLNEKEARIRNLKGLFRVSITGSLLPISKTLPGVVFYTRPDSIRLKGLTPIGGTFFQFVREGEDYRLVMPASGQFARGKLEDLGKAGDIGQVVELSLQAMDAVLGKTMGLNSNMVRLYEEDERFRIDIPLWQAPKYGEGEVVMTRLRVDKERYDIVHVDYLDQDGDVVRRIDCQDFRTVSSTVNSIETLIQLPFHISAEDDRLSGSVTLDFQELVANVGL